MTARRLAALFSFLAACGSKPSPSAGPGQIGSASPLSDQVLVQSKDLPDGLDMHLSNGEAGPPAIDHDKLPPAKKLSDPDAQALLARTKPISKDPLDQQAFVIRPGSAPAPSPGGTRTLAGRADLW